MSGQTELALLDLVGSAWVDLAAGHPTVAQWISFRHDELAKMPTWRSWGRPIRARRRATAYAKELAAVAAQLTAWAAGTVEDSWFADDRARRISAESSENDTVGAIGSSKSSSARPGKRVSGLP